MDKEAVLGKVTDEAIGTAITNINDAVSSIINVAIKGSDKAMDFLSAELPDVVHQLLVWNAIKYGVEMVIGLTILVIIAISYYKLYTTWNNSGEGKYSKDDEYIFGGCIGLIVAIPFSTLGVSLVNITWLQIIVAPKIWLIEYAAKLVK